MSYPKLIEQLISKFMKLPGVGRRSSERMVFWLLNHPVSDAQELSRAIIDLKNNLTMCRNCNNLAEADVCQICLDQSREREMICVVEEPKDLLAIERTGSFRGLYHVLMGAISPADGRGPDDLKFRQLFNRVKTEGIKEVVIATDADTDGETTALYLTKELKPLGIKVSRIGIGLPMGSSVEYADMSTLSMSMSSRREI